MIILVTLNFAAYLLNKFIGEQRGTFVSGILGGFASSTAVSWVYSRKSKELSGSEKVQSVAIILASAIMFPRILIWLYIMNKDLLADMAIPVFVIALAAGGGSFWIFKKKRGAEHKTADRGMRNPLNITDALKFGVIYASILLLVAYAKDEFGEKGVYIASGISGLADIDAIAISMAKLSGSKFSLFVSHNAIILAALANTLVKYGLCLIFGNRELKRLVGYGFLPVLGVGVVYLGVRMVF